MKTTITDTTTTSTTFTIVADAKDLADHKAHALEQAGKELKVEGFRKGKAPAAQIEKHADAAVLTDSFLNSAVPSLVNSALEEQKLSSAIAPSVNVTKFVPYSELELEVKTEYVGKTELADYTKLKRSFAKVELEQSDIDAVFKRMQFDLSEKEEVDRAAKDGDQVWIDFDGLDDKGQPVNGAKGTDHPLALGSNTFIPGFEENLVGLSKGDEKTFTLTFPKDYGVKTLAERDVTFRVVVKKVQAVNIPELDDSLAQKVGPYKTIDELTADIEKQLLGEKQNKAQLALESDIMQELVNKSQIELPDGMVDEQVKRIIADQQANLAYRGQTYDQWLADQGLTAEKHAQELRPAAVDRIKGGVVLSELAKAEKIEATDAEIEATMSQYRQQFAKDEKMMSQLKTEGARRDITARLLTDKALRRLLEIVVR